MENTGTRAAGSRCRNSNFLASAWGKLKMANWRHAHITNGPTGIIALECCQGAYCLGTIRHRSAGLRSKRAREVGRVHKCLVLNAFSFPLDRVLVGFENISACCCTALVFWLRTPILTRLRHVHVSRSHAAASRSAAVWNSWNVAHFGIFAFSCNSPKRKLIIGQLFIIAVSFWLIPVLLVAHGAPAVITIEDRLVVAMITQMSILRQHGLISTQI
mmetsp:Transcript_12223/g.17725  ORF Transcript_12223/g.17725 Transcript_12223/m.17725 type:complete len:216 (+) Transcript_12223:466-1113(+)